MIKYKSKLTKIELLVFNVIADSNVTLNMINNYINKLYLDNNINYSKNDIKSIINSLERKLLIKSFIYNKLTYYELTVTGIKLFYEKIKIVHQECK